MPRAGGTVDRGYGREHKRLRAQWAPLVAAGEVFCARCGRWIVPGSPWQLDHTDDRLGYLGPAHKRCNEVAGARKGGRVRAARRRPRVVSEEWL